MEHPWYITGLVDGEGCFSVSFSLRKKMRYGIEVRPSFALSQHRRNIETVRALRAYFRCGSVRYSSRDHNYKYEVRSTRDLQRMILPHFTKYPLQTIKASDSNLLSQICDLIARNRHRTAAGLRQIIKLAYQMNEAGQRRYTKRQLLRLVNKKKV